MKTKYLKEYTGTTLIEHLEKVFGIELTDYQKYQILVVNRSWLYGRWCSDSKRPSFLLRLTLPFYLIWSLCYNFIIQPINWLVTGKYYLNTNSIIYKFSINWDRKLHL